MLAFANLQISQMSLLLQVLDKLKFCPDDGARRHEKPEMNQSNHCNDTL